MDTYDTLASGLPNALTTFQELRAAGRDPRAAIRLDSGDLARLSKIAYRMFTDAGFDDPLIVASNELDEDLIADLKRQGARINSWGVGTHLITSSHYPALGGVYKLMAAKSAGGAAEAGGEAGGWEPRIKTSSNPAKMTDPGRKRVIRYRDAEGHPVGDVMYLADEEPPSGPRVTYEGRVELGFPLVLEGVASGDDLLEQVVRGGRRIDASPPLGDVRARSIAGVRSLPEELRRLRNPEIYHVGLSPALALLKADLIHHATERLPVRNSSIAWMTSVGRSSCGTWPAPGIVRRVAPGMRSAARCAAAAVTTRSASPRSTRVGTAIRPSSASLTWITPASVSSHKAAPARGSRNGRA